MLFNSCNYRHWYEGFPGNVVAPGTLLYVFPFKSIAKIY